MSALAELRNAGCKALLSAAGGAIIEAEADGIPLLVPAQSPGLASRVHGREASFPLVPFAGRIEHNAFRFGGKSYRLEPNTPDPLVLHGDGWQRQWTLAGHGPDYAVLRLDTEAGAGSPYAFRAEQRLELLPRGFRLDLSVENRGPEVLPFGLGVHPYLPLTPASTVAFGAGALWSERELHLPGERRALSSPLDFTHPRRMPEIWINTCYEAWSGRAVISTPNAPSILLCADPVFRWLMVYKPAGPSGFVCLEPMTHRPNAHGDPDSGGLIPLGPGQRLSGAVTLELEA